MILGINFILFVPNALVVPVFNIAEQGELC